MYYVHKGWFMVGVILLLLMSACGGSSMSDDEKEIAVAVALTQTASALDQAPTSPPATPLPAETATPLSADTPVPPVDTPAPAVEKASTATPLTEPTAVPAARAATIGAEPLPVTQSATKVRTLLVAPGEPGALYALLSDEPDDTAPVKNGRLLISRDFGVTWAPAPSGLPGAEGCLNNVSMDYYGATALYASTCQGLYRWSEAQPTWTLLSPEPTGMVAVTYGNADLIWGTKPFGVEGAPVMRSQDGGKSWTDVAMAHTQGVATLGISPHDSRTGYAITWPDATGSNLRRGSFFSDWQVMPTPLNSAVISPAMTIDGGTGALYVTTTANGAQLWRSTNPDTSNVENVQWEKVYDFQPSDQVELLASGWSSAKDELAIYANLHQMTDGAQKFTLIRSVDSGRNWEPLVIGE
ncbi:MAG: hypothetical protein R3C14_25395 [Caldilineaceae bacterium]